MGLLLAAVANAQTIYHDASAFPLLGKATESTLTRYERLPDSLQNISRKPLWDLGRNSAGLAVRFRSMIDYISRDLPDDTIVYLLHHSEITDSGKIKAKTVGKMLDNQLTVEGLFSVVLYCRSDGHRYHFETQTDGYTTAKSPKDMFNLLEIDNDLKMVDGAIREYWGLNTEK